MRRVIVAVLLALAVSMAAGAPARAASPPPAVQHVVVRPQAGVGPLIKWLISQAGRAIGRQARQHAVDAAANWSRRRAINWYCTEWWRYYGYSYPRWRNAAYYYYGPRWAWNYCAANWR